MPLLQGKLRGIKNYYKKKYHLSGILLLLQPAQFLVFSNLNENPSQQLIYLSVVFSNKYILIKILNIFSCGFRGKQGRRFLSLATLFQEHAQLKHSFLYLNIINMLNDIKQVYPSILLPCSENQSLASWLRRSGRFFLQHFYPVIQHLKIRL